MQAQSGYECCFAHRICPTGERDRDCASNAPLSPSFSPGHALAHLIHAMPVLKVERTSHVGGAPDELLHCAAFPQAAFERKQHTRVRLKRGKGRSA